jgi:hypothetical protein
VSAPSYAEALREQTAADRASWIPLAEAVVAGETDIDDVVAGMDATDRAAFAELFDLVSKRDELRTRAAELDPAVERRRLHAEIEQMKADRARWLKEWDQRLRPLATRMRELSGAAGSPHLDMTREADRLDRVIRHRFDQAGEAARRGLDNARAKVTAAKRALVSAQRDAAAGFEVQLASHERRLLHRLHVDGDVIERDGEVLPELARDPLVVRRVAELEERRRELADLEARAGVGA